MTHTHGPSLAPANGPDRWLRSSPSSRVLSQLEIERGPPHAVSCQCRPGGGIAGQTLRMGSAIPSRLMLVSACLQHWYTSIIFFSPMVIVGVWLWLSNRRERRRDAGAGPGSGAPSA